MRAKGLGRQMRPPVSLQAMIFSPIHSLWKSFAFSISWRVAMKYQPSGNGEGSGASSGTLRPVVTVHYSLLAYLG